MRVIQELKPRPQVEALSERDYQDQVASYFDASSLYRVKIYGAQRVHDLIHKQRAAVVLEWMEDLGLPLDSRILEVGCGAGLTTIELAHCGYVVDDIDSS